MFLVPVGLYTGGLMGICQVIRTVLVDYLHICVGSIDVAGIIYYIINIPIFLYAFPRMEKLFFVKTFVSVTAITVFMSVIPQKCILDDVLSSSIVGAVISGAGIGFVLRMSGSGGGMDIVGMLMSKSSKNMSVGKANLAVNLALYGVCLFLFDIRIVIYSMLYAVLYSFVMDKVHVQNINVEVKIITKADTSGMEQEIFSLLGRGITEWRSIGAYTSEDSRVLYVLLSKYEIAQLRSIVHKYDPSAFIVINEGIRVDGNYLKKL
jgi:uncharacterized membrane-anchored protein YitT (DUF2179 family)